MRAFSLASLAICISLGWNLRKTAPLCGSNDETAASLTPASALSSDLSIKFSASSLVHLTAPNRPSTPPVIPLSTRSSTTLNIVLITGVLVESVASRTAIKLAMSSGGFLGSDMRGITIPSISGGGCGRIAARIKAAIVRIEGSSSSSSAATWGSCGDSRTALSNRNIVTGLKASRQSLRTEMRGELKQPVATDTRGRMSSAGALLNTVSKVPRRSESASGVGTEPESDALAIDSNSFRRSASPPPDWA